MFYVLKIHTKCTARFAYQKCVASVLLCLGSWCSPLILPPPLSIVILLLHPLCPCPAHPHPGILVPGRVGL